MGSKLALVLLLAASFCAAQAPNAAPQQSNTPKEQTADPAPTMVVIPAGTRMLLTLLSPISTGAAKPGDGVYLQTVTPVAVGNQTVIPPGTYVEGVLDRVVRPGRVKGRGELQLHFTSITFPSGYHQSLLGTIGSAPSDESATVGKEGTVQEKGSKGKDTGVVVANTGTGAVIGAIAGGGKGAGIGAGIGAAAGLATVLLTRGNEVRMNEGDPIEMVLERPITLEHTEAEAGSRAMRPMRMGPRMRRTEDRPMRTPYPGIPPLIRP